MKKIISTLLFISLSVSVFAQFESRYDFGNAPPILQECDKLGKVRPFKFAPPAGYSFKISSTYNADTVIGTCLLFGVIQENNLLLNNANAVSNYQMYNCESVNNTIVDSLNKASGSSKDGNKLLKYKTKSIINETIPLVEVEEYRLYFLIPVAYLTKYSTPFYKTGLCNSSFVIGAQAKLFKIRLKNFDFAKDVSFSTTFGAKIRTNKRKDNFLNIVSSIGVSLNDLDKTSGTKLLPDSTAKNVGALSIGFGVIKEYGKAQISIMIGKDFMSKANNDKYNWIYNCKTWLSFGVGIGIFTGDDGKKQSTTEKQ